MRRVRKSGADDWLWSYVDILLLSFFAVCSYALLAMASINPPASADPQTKPPGIISVLACWPAGSTDVDLWAIAPGQAVATGYSDKTGRVWSLLRDDMGTVNDASPVNCESMFAGATPDGLYAVNLHAYSVPSETTVHVEIAINGHLLLQSDMALKPKQERTVAQFSMADGKIVPGSVNGVYVPLRSGAK